VPGALEPHISGIKELSQKHAVKKMKRRKGIVSDLFDSIFSTQNLMPSCPIMPITRLELLSESE